MATLKIVDYVPMMDRVLQHWAEVEEARGEAVQLPDGTTREMLQALRPALVDAQETLVVAANAHEKTTGRLELARTAIFTVGRRFNEAVRGEFPGTTFVKSLPRIPSFSADPERQLMAFRDMRNLWQQIDAPISPTAPVTLGSGFKVTIEEGGIEKNIARADFEARLSALTSASRDVQTTFQVQDKALQTRNKRHETLKALFTAYRKRIRGLYPPTSVLRRTLP
jgi:hypothetical protein